MLSAAVSMISEKLPALALAFTTLRISVRMLERIRWLCSPMVVRACRSYVAIDSSISFMRLSFSSAPDLRLSRSSVDTAWSLALARSD